MSAPTPDFAPVRAEFELPSAAETDRFPAEVIAEAAEIAAADLPDIEDATAMPFVTIDPPGSKDLDQAMFLERVGTGFRVHYAIADLGSVIPAGGAIDVEARRRGQTFYLPDGRVPLHPPTLSEDALSLLPDQVRRAAVWTIDVDADGEPTRASVRRALVKSIARFDYEGVQASFDKNEPHPSIEPLADLGRSRQELRLGLGAIELALPEQEVVRDGDRWRVTMRIRTDVDAWNAEISLLTGMAAAQLMLTAKLGILRTLPVPDDDAVKTFLHAARTLKLDVPDGVTPAELLADLDPDRPTTLALMTEATRLLRGAGYDAFDGAPPSESGHAGIGGPYAHVTAPLRRLTDRFGTEVCLAVCEKREVAGWVREALPALPEIMKTSDQHASKIDRACIDRAELWMLAGRRGDLFEAVVMHADDDGGEVLIEDPPVIADVRGKGLQEGGRTHVRLRSIDEERGRPEFVVERAQPS